MSHQHYEGCYLHHFPCALERIRDLERQLAMHQTKVQTGPILTHASALPCGDIWFTHHGDEPPSATP